MLKRAAVILFFCAVSILCLLSLPIIGEVQETIEERRHTPPPISEYDDIMRTVENESGVDWRLLSAIAYVESGFDGEAVSKRGAVGIMQIMPSTGRYFGIPEGELAKPDYNIRAAAFLLCEVAAGMQLPENLPDDDRLGLVLACYNGGFGHVSDARRLARAHGENMNSWIVVSRYLRLKSEPQYYEHEVVKYGRFKGGRSTTAYVRNVLKRYEHYRRLTEKAEKAEEKAE